MTDYFDFVLAKHNDCDRTYLFRAPAWSGLKKGDSIKVETKRGQKLATVVSTITLRSDDTEKIDFIMHGTGAAENVRKVISKVTYVNFEYSEEEDEQLERS